MLAIYSLESLFSVYFCECREGPGPGLVMLYDSALICIISGESLHRIKHVERASTDNAIETLMVTDELFRLEMVFCSQLPAR